MSRSFKTGERNCTVFLGEGNGIIINQSSKTFSAHKPKLLQLSSIFILASPYNSTYTMVTKNRCCETIANRCRHNECVGVGATGHRKISRCQHCITYVTIHHAVRLRQASSRWHLIRQCGMPAQQKEPASVNISTVPACWSEMDRCGAGGKLLLHCRWGESVPLSLELSVEASWLLLNGERCSHVRQDKPVTCRMILNFHSLR